MLVSEMLVKRRSATIAVALLLLCLEDITIDGYDSVDGHCPDKCLCLIAYQMSCVGAGLTDIPRSLSRSVTSVDLSKNSFVLLSSGSLESFRNVVRLTLTDNELEKVTDGVFESTPSLQTLKINSNNLTEIGQFTFRGVEMLLHLDLSYNKLEKVDGAFSGFRELSRLDLSGNELTELTQFTFRDLTSLRYLLLSHNRIHTIDKKAFRSLEKLMYLVLRGNPLADLPRIQFHSLSLSYVDLSECFLTRFPRGLPGSIRYLQLRRNNMTSLSRNSFRDCVYVEILVLDSNLISDIEDGAFEEMTYLKQLWLNDNRLLRLPQQLPIKLQRLFVEANRISLIPIDTFRWGSQLRTLSLAGNVIDDVKPETFLPLGRLKSLDLSNNKLSYIASLAFLNNTQLRYLNLDRNPIQRLSNGCLFGLKALQTLSIAYVTSADVYIDDHIGRDLVSLVRLTLDSSPGMIHAFLASNRLLFELSSLQELGILNSNLVTLRSDFPDFFPNLSGLNISSSMWHCNDSMKWFRAWFAISGVQIFNIDDNLCASPAHLRGRPILSLSDKDLGHPSNVPHLLRPSKTNTRKTTVPQTTAPVRHRLVGIFSNNFDGVDVLDSDLGNFIDAYEDDDVESVMTHSRFPSSSSLLPMSSTSITTTTTTNSPGTVIGELIIQLLPSAMSRPGRQPEVKNLLRTPSSRLENTDQLQAVYQYELDAIEPTDLTFPDGIRHHSDHSGKVPIFTVAVLVGAVAMAVLVILVAASVLVVIVTSRNSRREKALQRKRSSETNQLGQNSQLQQQQLQHQLQQYGQQHQGQLLQQHHAASPIVYNHNSNTLYFVPKSSGDSMRTDCMRLNEFSVMTADISSGNKFENKMMHKGQTVKVDAGEKMSLIPGRDINHEGPLRVYTWTDF